MAPIILTEKDKARFLSKLKRDEATGCLLFCGTTNNRGYGMFWVASAGHKIPARRVAFVLSGRSLTAEAPVVMHSCDQRCCCEPAHLQAGTQADNIGDMAAKGRGRKSKHGLPFGVYPAQRRFHGRFWAGSRWHRLKGGFDTAAEAAEAVQRALEAFRSPHH